MPGIFAQIVSVHQNLRFINIVEARNQAGDGDFPELERPTGNGFTRGNIQVDVTQVLHVPDR